MCLSLLRIPRPPPPLTPGFAPIIGGSAFGRPLRPVGKAPRGLIPPRAPYVAVGG